MLGERGRDEALEWEWFCVSLRVSVRVYIEL